MPSDRNPLDEFPQTSPTAGLPRALKIGILAVLVVAVVVGGVVIALRLRRTSAPADTQTAGVEATDQSPVTAPPKTTPIRTVPDSDGDRLADQEEQALNTNPQSPDTDADGLFDFEEAKAYRTDPRKPDSDGDGVSDGEEVRRGDNPLGPGQVRDVNAAILNANRTTNQ